MTTYDPVQSWLLLVHGFCRVNSRCSAEHVHTSRDRSTTHMLCVGWLIRAAFVAAMPCIVHGSARLRCYNMLGCQGCTRP
jgi:hypothetical protein